MKEPIISDQDALRILVPPSGFLHDYVHYAYTLTDAPVLYHVGMGMALLSAVVSTDLHVWADGGRKYPNLFLLIVGDSATARKSTALGIATDVLLEVAVNRVGRSPGSYEGLLKSLEEHPHQTVFESEFSRFLRQAQGQGHLNALKLGFVDLYDAKAISKVTSNRSVFIAKPRLSLVGAVAPSLLEQYLERADLTGGFWSRFLILEGVRDRFLPWTEPDEVKFKGLVEALTRIHHYCPPARGQHSPAVKASIDSWATQLDETIRDQEMLEEEQRSLFGRASGLLHRLALLFALDRYISELPEDAPRPNIVPPIDPIPINEQDLRYAAALVGVHVNCSFSILAELVDTRDMRHRRDVLRNIGSIPEPIGPISERSRLLKGRTEQIIRTLVAQGKVIQAQIADGNVSYVRSGHVAESDKPMDALAASMAWLDATPKRAAAAAVAAPSTPVVPTPPQLRQPLSTPPAGTVTIGPWAASSPLVLGEPED